MGEGLVRIIFNLALAPLLIEGRGRRVRAGRYCPAETMYLSFQVTTPICLSRAICRKCVLHRDIRITKDAD